MTRDTSTPSVLARILEETRAQVAWRKRSTPLEALAARVAAMSAPSAQAERESGGERARPRAGEAQGMGVATPTKDARRGRFHAALARPGIGVIAEFKRRSPSAGPMRAADLAGIVSAYEGGGAAALSVLTEGPNFDGSLEGLRAAREASGLPTLRKDFILDPYQLYEARAAGADAVLLIVAALDHDELASLHELARNELGLDVLVEVHDRDELDRAARIGAELIGVNNRDLRDFSVDVSRTQGLLADMPAGATVVSESGISTPEQLRALEREGVSAVLVGEALMRAEDPGRALAALLEGCSIR